MSVNKEGVWLTRTTRTSTLSNTKPGCVGGRRGFKGKSLHIKLVLKILFQEDIFLIISKEINTINIDD